MDDGFPMMASNTLNMTGYEGMTGGPDLAVPDPRYADGGYDCPVRDILGRADSPPG